MNQGGPSLALQAVSRVKSANERIPPTEWERERVSLFSLSSVLVAAAKGGRGNVSARGRGREATEGGVRWSTRATPSSNSTRRAELCEFV